MLYKIVISSDKKDGRVYFDTHSVGFYHSDGLVMELINEIVLEPSIRLEAYHIEKERRRLEALEVTQVIEVQLDLFKDVA